MSELHKFIDQASTPEGRAKPIPARKLDENFRVVRLRVASDLSEIFSISENFPNPDLLRVSESVPATGTYILGFVNRVPTLFETQDCEE